MFIIAALCVVVGVAVCVIGATLLNSGPIAVAGVVVASVATPVLRRSLPRWHLAAGQSHRQRRRLQDEGRPRTCGADHRQQSSGTPGDRSVTLPGGFNILTSLQGF